MIYRLEYYLTRFLWKCIGFVDGEGRLLVLKFIFIWMPFGFILGYGVFPTCIAIDIAMNIFVYLPVYLVKNRAEVMEILQNKTSRFIKEATRLCQSTRSLAKRLAKSLFHRDRNSLSKKAIKDI